MESNLPKLLLHKTQVDRPSMGTLGMGYMLRSLRDSGLFEIGSHDFYRTACRDYRATTVFLNGKKIYFDLWEYPTPTCTNEVFNDDFDLIIKLQWRKFTLEQFVSEARKQSFLVDKPIEEISRFFNKIVPWSFFPSRLLEPYIGRESELWANDIKLDGFFCGKDWKCRRGGKKMMAKAGLQYINSDQETRNIISDEQFMQMMKESKYGIVFPGRGSWATDTKNRREIDYMMMKKPLLLTYDPYYYNALVPGVHYIKWEWGQELADIEKKHDLNMIAENGYKWYLDNATPSGIAKTFLQIVTERLGNEILQDKG